MDIFCSICCCNCRFNLEPIPSAAIGIIGVTFAAVFGLVYTNPSDACKWALSGFSNSTIWLIL